MTRQELRKWANSLNELPFSHLIQLSSMSPNFYFVEKELIWANSDGHELDKILKAYYDQLPEIEQLLLIKTKK